MKIAVVLLSILLWPPLLVPAMPQVPETPPDFRGPVEAVSHFLSLSETQATHFVEILGAFHSAMQNLQIQAQRRQHALEELLTTPQPDPTAVGQALLEVRALQVQGERMTSRYHQAFIGLLTPEQLQRVQMVAQARELIPAVGVFAALHLIEPPNSPPR